jgi:hypothetical protein
MSHIFISYSRSDIDFARYLRASLEAESFRVWMDEKQLSAGMDWWGEIEANIDNCSAFLVIMSPEARDSVFVQNEILRAIDQKKPIFPVLLSGKSFGILAHVQFQDMRGGLNATLSQEFIERINKFAGKVEMQDIQFEILYADAVKFAADALILKTASGSSGLEAQVASALAKAGKRVRLGELQETGDYELIDSYNLLPAKKCLFIRTVSIFEFSYREVREFFLRALEILGTDAPDVEHVAMTVQGVNTVLRLDEGESLLAQIAGLLDAIKAGKAPKNLKRISVIDRNKSRIGRLQSAVTPYFEEVNFAERLEGGDWAYRLNFSHQQPVESPDAGQETVKPYAFVLLPHADELEDIFFYGIQRPVHAMGLLCERNADNEETSQDLSGMMQRIGKARAFIADVSDRNPELYLQLGYALGKGIPVALISQRENPDFQDVIAYQKIWELEERLSQWLKGHF